MKAKLEFDLDEIHDLYAFKRASSATDAYLALSEIANEIFRPARKHGYSDQEINKLIESTGIIKIECGDVQVGYEIISQLEDKFYSILRKYEVNLDNLE